MSRVRSLSWGQLAASRQAHVILQALNLRQAVVTQIEFFEVHQSLQSLHLGNTVTLDRENLEVGECGQVLMIS